MFSQFFNSIKCDSSCSNPTVARIPPHAQEVLSRAETIDAPKRKQLRFPKCWKLKQQENNGTPVCSFPCHLPSLSLPHFPSSFAPPPPLVDFFMPHLLYVTSQQGRLPAAGERSWPPTQRPAALILQAGTELSCSPEQRLRKQEDITHLSTPTIYPGGFQNTDKSSQRDSIINLHWGIETRLPWEETQDLIRGKHYKSSLYCYCGVTMKKPCALVIGSMRDIKEARLGFFRLQRVWTLHALWNCSRHNTDKSGGLHWTSGRIIIKKHNYIHTHTHAYALSYFPYKRCLCRVLVCTHHLDLDINRAGCGVI